MISLNEQQTDNTNTEIRVFSFTDVEKSEIQPSSSSHVERQVMVLFRYAQFAVVVVSMLISNYVADAKIGNDDDNPQELKPAGMVNGDLNRDYESTL